MVIQLYRSDEEYLMPREIVSRLVKSMPTVLVDWAEADRILEVQRRRLVDLRAPEPIQLSHNSHFGETAYIELRLPEYPGMIASGMVYRYDSISLECQAPPDEQFLFDVGRRMMAILGYQMTVPERVTARRPSES